ncbi:hypothetical protein EXIGLDRAFT_63179 [Exidia glandulosa HHB12029]|uniref:Zn(2)-C6 fungal-type domain-containing protein n=1 Tax=Exidia glandulosa HHB12029 TaxID=1314781 RepID=A0A165P0E4_EXIGL|nr:hypothetical protein EXIGLDRAFT_63179 [Exidia glandulosa HHB12029]
MTLSPPSSQASSSNSTSTTTWLTTSSDSQPSPGPQPRPRSTSSSSSRTCSSSSPTRRTTTPTSSSSSQTPRIRSSSSSHSSQDLRRPWQPQNRRSRKRKTSARSSRVSDSVQPAQTRPTTTATTSRRARDAGACTHCKKLKMKCEFPDDENVCRRCKAGGHECIVEGRKPRTAPNKREYLLAQIRQKDRTIQFLLKQIQAGQGPASAASPPSSSTFNPTISESGADDGRSQAILNWLNRAGRSPSSGLESEPTIELNITDVDQPLRSLPPEPAPLGMLANLAIRDVPSRPSSVGDPEDNSDGEIGVARSDYFMNPGIDSRRLASDDQSRPDLLVKGIINFEEVDELFEIFFSRLNVILTILDPVLHTPASTFARCPFLFTIVCATAARYYAKRPELHTIAMHFARDAAAHCVTQGFKSIELCQAYIIMATYAVPAKRWEEDRNWLYIGLAIRIATDLNLHLTTSTKPTNEIQEREILNRTRVWLICFNLDRSTSTQFGKMATLREDYIVRTSPEWYRESAYNSKYDVHLCAYTQLLRVMAHFIEEVFSDENSCSGLNKNVDWLEVTNRYNDEFTRYEIEQQQRFANDSDPSDPSCVYRTYLLPFLLGYSRLVMHSFGFQSAIDRGVTKGDVFFQRCMDAATQVCTVLLERLAPTGYLRYAPDGYFLFAAFASAFLVKMLRLEYAHLIDGSERDRIVSLITRVIDTLGSREISIDDKHTPKLYSRFLASLLARQQAAAKDARNRSRRTTPKTATTFMPAQHSPQSSLHVPAQAPYPTHQAHQQQHGHMAPAAPMHNPGDLLQVVDNYDVSDAGTDATIERHDELPADEMLAGMHALDNPAWWTNVMMPGYTNTWQSNAPVYAPSYPTNVGYGAPQQMPQQQQQPQQHMASLQQGALPLNYMGPR